MLPTTLDRNPAFRTRRRARSATKQAHRRHACSDRRPVGEPQPAETGVQVTGLIATPISAGINPGSRRWVKPWLSNITPAAAMADGATAVVDPKMTFSPDAPFGLLDAHLQSQP
jgi:hypothetical protein